MTLIKKFVNLEFIVINIPNQSIIKDVLYKKVKYLMIHYVFNYLLSKSIMNVLNNYCIVTK
jgi:hypothetical protein